MKMIGKPEWFTYRIAGWGLRPKTKEGWAYIAVAILLFWGASMMPVPLKWYGIGILAAILIMDAIHIMLNMGRKHDERERYHQLLIERAASFAGVVAVVAVALYQMFLIGEQPDTSLIIILVAMALTKFTAWAYVKLKM